MTTLRDISAEDSAAYYGEAQRLHWSKATASGRLEATDAAIRPALADAAILLLAVGGPGANATERAVRTAFPRRPGVASSTRARARAGSLRPRVLTLERLAMSRT